MLILTREKDESVVICAPIGKIEVIILHVTTNGKVTLGFTAPKSVPVHRMEIMLAIEREERERSKDGTKPNLPGSAH